MSKTVLERYTNMLCYIAFLIIVVLAAFRGEAVGADTMDYIDDYDDVKTMSFNDVAIGYEGYLGYYYLSKVFASWGAPLWLWFGFAELLFVSAIGRMIFSYSKDKLYSVILFVVLGHFMFSMAGMKQTMAMSLMIHSFLDLTEKKYLRSLVLIPIAYFFHPVVMIFVVAHLLFLFRNTKLFYLIATALPIVVAVGAMSTLAFLVMVMDNSHFETYLEEDNSYSFKTMIFYLLLLACSLPCLPAYFKKNAVAKVELACLFMALAFQYL
nr:EpsG family protein [Bacteroidales bacterium]